VICDWQLFYKAEQLLNILQNKKGCHLSEIIQKKMASFYFSPGEKTLP